MKKEEMNLELRKEILGMSLVIESHLNKLLLIILQVGKDPEKRKALGNKSSSLSLNNKATLLFDLEILENAEYQMITLFSEFRNQFIHNMNCISFVSAVAFLGGDRGKKLLKCITQTENKEEENYIKSYYELFHQIVRVIISKIENYESEQKYNCDTLCSTSKYGFFIENKESELHEKIKEICRKNKELNGEKLLILITKEIEDELASDTRTEKRNKYYKELENIKSFIPKLPLGI